MPQAAVKERSSGGSDHKSGVTGTDGVTRKGASIVSAGRRFRIPWRGRHPDRGADILTSKDITNALADARGISNADARAQVAAVLQAIAEGVAKGDVALAGFGKFTVSRRAARPGRNPRSGETMVIGPSTRIGFRAAKALKDRVAKR